MTKTDIFQIATLVIMSLGGGGGIVLGLSRFLGERWLQNWKGDIDARLQRLDAALVHRNFLLQRLAEFELEALTECWRAARACLPLINDTRPRNGGTDNARLNAAVSRLSDAHDTLIGTLGKHELHLPADVVESLDVLGRLVRKELSEAPDNPFETRWWQQGEQNRDAFKDKSQHLLDRVRARVLELRAQASAEAEQR